MAMMLRSGGRQGPVVDGTGGGTGRGPLGCFETKRSQVALLLGARPEEVRTLQALARSPSLARETAIWTAVGLWVGAGKCPGEWCLDARLHSALYSPLDH